MKRRQPFVRGLLLGTVLSLLTGLSALYLLDTLGIISISLLRVPEVGAFMDWLRRNLGLSLVPFSITLVLYLYSLSRLSASLEQAPAAEEVAQMEHLIDVWISLFFGIGVIWTAIGMRGALLYALGDGDTLASTGAFEVLRRLVDGGILTALSTTILGGIGGYLMRLAKTFFLGARLNRYYGGLDQQHTGRTQQLLEDIRCSIGRLAEGAAEPAERSGAGR